MSLQSQWVVSRKFDLSFFLLPFLLGLVYFLLILFLPAYVFIITAIVWVVFAQTHFGSTWFLYLDKKNREYFNKNKFVYYIMPLIILASVLYVGWYNLALLVIIISIASLYHVTKQSYGILQLYRMRNQEFDKAEKQDEMIALFGWSIFFAGFGAFQLPDFRQYIVPIENLVRIGLWALFIVMIFYTLKLVYQFIKRKQNSVQKNVFLIGSLILYSPYLYAAVILVDIYQMEIATLTSLIAHYMQYMGIVWLVNRNKYGKQTEYAEKNPVLKTVSSKIPLIIAAILGYALLMAGFRWGIPQENLVLYKIIPNVVLALVAIHFYIDAFVWKFSNPYYRETVLPFIKEPSKVKID
jgi:hypothetical protein